MAILRRDMDASANRSYTHQPQQPSQSSLPSANLNALAGLLSSLQPQQLPVNPLASLLQSQSAMSAYAPPPTGPATNANGSNLDVSQLLQMLKPRGGNINPVSNIYHGSNHMPNDAPSSSSSQGYAYQRRA